MWQCQSQCACVASVVVATCCHLLTFNVCIRRNAAQIFEANNRLTDGETGSEEEGKREGGKADKQCLILLLPFG